MNDNHDELPPERKSDRQWVYSLAIPETYRKAKRNSLIWSGLTILAALGIPVSRGASDSNTSDLAIIPFTGLSYPIELIILLFSVVASFMIMGFIRETRMLNIGNSEYRLRRKHRTMQEIFESIGQIAEEFEEGLMSIKSDLETVENDVTIVIKAAERRIQHAASQIAPSDIEFREEAKNLDQHARQNPSNPYPHIVTFAEKLIAKFDNTPHKAIETANAALHPVNDVIVEARAGIEKAELLENSEKNRTKEIRQILNDIEQFATAIDAGDLKWHRWHDRMPVWGLFYLAAAASLTWLAIESGVFAYLHGLIQS